jgi:hypothetical protein
MPSIQGHPLTTPVITTAADELINELTPEQAEALLQRAALTNRDWAEKTFAEASIDAFLSRYPAYLDNDANRALMKSYLKQRNLPTTTASLETAYNSLKNFGLLALDPAELRKEEAAKR